MRRLAKKVVAQFGFEIRRSPRTDHAWSRDPFQAQKFLMRRAGVESPTIFDIGAYRGDTVATYRALFPRSTIYCFEPFPESFDALKGRFGNDERTVPLEVAIAEKCDRKQFFVNHFDATNSLLRRPSTGRRYYHEAGTLKEATWVTTTSLDEFVQTHPLEDAALVKLDVQGSELAALRGASGMLRAQRAALLYIEVAFVSHHERQPLFHELWHVLNEFGYTLFDLYELHNADNGQLRYGDALFVNRFVRTEVIDKFPSIGD
jgi:FkbM family methyltransferase